MKSGESGGYARLSLTRTKAALEAYDELDAQWRAEVARDQPDNAREHRLYELLCAAELAVGEAFAQDTADRNDPRDARRISPQSPWLRDLVKKYG